MHFTFDSELDSFITTVSDFIRNDYSPQHIRNSWKQESPFSAEKWQSMVGLGITQMNLDGKFHGMGLPLDEASLVYEELAYGGVIEPIIEQSILVNNLAHYFPTDLQKLISSKLVDGFIAVAHPLSPLVNHLSQAAGLLSIKETSIVYTDIASVSHTILPSNDPSRKLSRIESLENSQVFQIDNNLEQKIVSSGKVMTGIMMLGLSRRCLDITSEYVKTREQFGKPIGSFQAVKHMLADVAVKIEFAKAAIYRAANSIDTNNAYHALHANIAKYLAAQAGEIAAKNSIQAHGAMGYTWEVDLHIFMRRIWAITSQWSSAGEIELAIDGFLQSNLEDLGSTFTFREK
ncbi:MAG: acyl-CoA dehydrogenase family protein [Gammaproteobacteria bacterium]|jgi:alkylation response protein AidB-like acyl-CoA dehydrogenase